MNVFNLSQWRDINRCRLKDALAAFSFAQLLFFRILLNLLNPVISVFYAVEPHNRSDYRAALLDIFLLAGLIFALLRSLRRIKSPRLKECARFLCLAAFLFPLDQIRSVLGASGEVLLGLGKPFLAGCVALSLLLVCRYYRALSLLAYRVCLGAVFMGCLTIPGLVRWAVEGTPQRSPAAASFSKRASPPSALRVGWIIFDEWDERVTFDARPKAALLPNIDALAKSAVVAANAYPPAGNTLQSISDLLLGRYLQNMKSTAEGGLRTQTFGSTNWDDFTGDTHLVRLALEAGRRVGVVGWNQPYPRLLGARADLWTLWEPLPWQLAFSRRDVVSGCAAQLCFAFNSRWQIHQHAMAVAGLLRAGSQLLQNPNVDLVFLHLPIPHAPRIYNPKTGRYDTWFVSRAEGYFDNLALVDRAVGEFESDLARSGLAGRTALVFSSDHWWRTSVFYDGVMEHRVPFIVQLPNFSTPRTFSRPINTIMTKDLILSLLNGTVRTPDQVVAFMESRAQLKPAAYQGILNYGVPP
jgi:hypothetical protein